MNTAGTTTPIQDVPDERARPTDALEPAAPGHPEPDSPGQKAGLVPAWGIAGSETLSERLIAAMRALMALAALVIICLDPAEPNRYVTVTYSTLWLYLGYSLALYAAVLRQPRAAFWQKFLRWNYWLDVGWFTLLIALSSGTNSIFFQFYFFIILVASFRFGFKAGWGVTVVSAVLFSLVGYFTLPGEAQFQMNRFLLRPACLLILGYMVSCFGEFETTLKQRLSLLREINTLSNPRFGIDRTLGSILERLRAFYDADSCVLALQQWNGMEPQLRRAGRGAGDSAAQPRVLPAELQQLLLTLPDEEILVLRGQRANSHFAWLRVPPWEWKTPSSNDASEMLGTIFDTDSFLSVPVTHRGSTIGRLFLLSPVRQVGEADVTFLLQAVDHVMPLLENVSLLDHMASDAADVERWRIARDIHDSLIQPYIGLRMGLEALRQTESAGVPPSGQHASEKELGQLIEIADMGIEELRRYVSGLRTAPGSARKLVDAVAHFTQRFTAATTIRVDVEAQEDMEISDRLAAEIIQIVAEALSNIRRHTRAEHARVQLSCDKRYVVIRVSNQQDAFLQSPAEGRPFTPRSITERATALGGFARVVAEDGETVVKVTIPL